MTIESIVIILLIGGIGGWLAGLVVQGTGLGVFGDILIGIVGGFLGSWLLGKMGVAMPGGPIVAGILTAFIGAVVMLLAIVLLMRLFGARRRI